MMEKSGLDPDQAIECLDDYIERTRNMKLSDIVDVIIETKLTNVQKRILTDYWFKNISPAETAANLGMSLSSVYSAKSKAQSIIKDHLEPLLMYLRDVDSCDAAPVTLACLNILKAQKSKETAIGEALEKLRIGNAVASSVLSKALGISEKELLYLEKGKKDVSTKLLAKYCVIFNTDIEIQCVNGQWRLKWTDR